MESFIANTDDIEITSSSHKYKLEGYKIEEVSNRILGLIHIKWKTRFGWTKWKFRYIEVFGDGLTLWKYTSKKKQYKRMLWKFRSNCRLGGLGYTNEIFSFSLWEGGKKKFIIESPNKTCYTLLYKYLATRLL